MSDREAAAPEQEIREAMRDWVEADHRALMAKLGAALSRANAAEVRVAELEDALRTIAEEAGYASGGNYQPDIARWARDVLSGATPR